MYIVAMIGKNVVIADAMFNMPSLPKSRFSVFGFRCGHPFLNVQARAARIGDTAFNQFPAGRMVGMIGRKFPDAMY